MKKLYFSNKDPLDLFPGAKTLKEVDLRYVKYYELILPDEVPTSIKSEYKPAKDEYSKAVGYMIIESEKTLNNPIIEELVEKEYLTDDTDFMGKDFLEDLELIINEKLMA